ncbi:MAG: prepilin-type N-terminal cleavage/methylation domain-containing protein [Armatimonadota bacterium]
MMHRRRQIGFTLIELLVVVAIICMLASIIFPAFSRAENKARETTCLSNQHQIALAITMKTQDNTEAFPTADVVWNELNLDSKEVLRCPLAAEGASINYVYSFFVSGRALGEIQYPADELLIADGQSKTQSFNGKTADNMLLKPADLDFRHGGRMAFLGTYCDGHSAIQREAPPMWVYNITQTWEFNEEVLGAATPTLAFFYTKSPTSTPEFHYCQSIDPVVQNLAKAYRLRLKVVRVNASNDLLAKYGIIPGDPDTGYPAFLFFRAGKETDRLSGFPSDTTGWTPDDWQAEVGLCQQQLVERINAAL